MSVDLYYVNEWDFEAEEDCGLHVLVAGRLPLAEVQGVQRDEAGHYHRLHGEGRFIALHHEYTEALGRNIRVDPYTGTVLTSLEVIDAEFEVCAQE
jgi:hypothetical protein